MNKPWPALFKWRHFEPEIIVCAVRWYLRFSLRIGTLRNWSWNEAAHAMFFFVPVRKLPLDGQSCAPYCAARVKTVVYAPTELAKYSQCRYRVSRAIRTNQRCASLSG